jgi:UPF0716 protein FxsA
VIVREIRLPPGMLLAAVALFMLLPLAELGLLIWSAVTIGFWWTLLACVVTGVVGSAIARWQGLVTMRRAQEALASGQFPADAILDGAFVLVGGVLLLTPGFLTDLMGMAFLLPPTRAGLKALARRWWRARSGVIDAEPL